MVYERSIPMSMSDEDVIALMRGNEERVAAREKKAAMKEATEPMLP